MSFKAYTAKYFATKGILEVTVNEGSLAGMVKVISVQGKPIPYPWFLHAREWHLKREDAVKQARLKAGAKINSLHKQIKKLEKLILEDLK